MWMIVVTKTTATSEMEHFGILVIILINNPILDVGRGPEYTSNNFAFYIC